MIKVVSFDIGGTLLRCPKKRNLRELLKKSFKINEENFNYAYREHFIKKRVDENVFFELIECSQKYISEIKQIINSYYNSIPKGSLFVDVIPVITELNNKGISLISVSNKSYKNIATLKTYGIERFFSKEFYSCDIGYAKPEYELFKYVQSVIGVEPESILHVGDSLKSDIIGASQMNWKTAYILRQMENIKDSTIAEYQISDLFGVLSVVDILQ